MFLIVTSCKTQLTPEMGIEKLGANPYFEVDNQPVSQDDILNYDASDIAYLKAYYDKKATRQFGDKGKDGAVLIMTKEFATSKYETLFKEFSEDYEKMINKTNKEEIQYILNGRILTDNFEGSLASLNSKLLKKITLIDQKELSDKFKIQDKNVGVIIQAKRPKNLYNSKEKF